MTFKQTKDIIDRVRFFHKQLSDFYANLLNRAEKQRVKMLLYYLSRHEKHLEEVFAEYKNDVPKKIMDTWFQYLPEKIPPECFEEFEIEPNISVDEVFCIAMKLDNCLIKLFREMAEKSEIDEVKDLFNHLLEMEKQEELNLARDVLWLKDI